MTNDGSAPSGENRRERTPACGTSACSSGQAERCPTAHSDDAQSDHRRRRADRELRQSVRHQWPVHVGQRADRRQAALRRCGRAVQLGVAIIPGQVAATIVLGLRSFALAREAVVAGQLIADARKASVLYSALNLTLQAGLPTLTQRAMGGKGGPREFAENALGIVLTNAAIASVHGLFKNPGAVAQEVRTWAQSPNRRARSRRATVGRRRDRGGPCCAFADALRPAEGRDQR